MYYYGPFELIANSQQFSIPLSKHYDI